MKCSEKRFKMKFVFGAVWLSVLWGSALSECNPPSTNECIRSPVRCANATEIDCSNLKYRTLDGSCNNPIDPSLGMAMTAFQRLIPSAYEDGIYSIRLAKSGNPLPSARLLAFTAFGREPINDRTLTLLNMQWGQLVAHDSSNIRGPNSPGLIPSQETRQTCCSRDGRLESRVSPACFPIPVPAIDPFFKDRDCLDFTRSVTDKDQKCPGTEGRVPAEQISGVTHYMDLSIVYGNSDAQTRSLRTLNGGLLRTEDGVWPPQTDSPQTFCRRSGSEEACFELGDFRGNQNSGLTILQVLFLREHNRLARMLAAVNPHWDDETLFQEARRINIAQYQHITYYQWLPSTYRTSILRKKRLINTGRAKEYVNDYDACADPRSIQSFMHSVFRYLHTQIVGTLQLINESRKFNETIELLDHLNSPGILQQPCKYSQLVRGLSTQRQGSTDENFDFAAAEKFGSDSIDLRAFDIQRDRDHGLPSYNDFREYCGLKRATSWNDFLDQIRHKDLALLRLVYESHEDVDLTIGGSLERRTRNSVFGRTFECIALKHFKNQRTGDRYFYENGNQPNPFTLAQLKEIRKATAAKLLCNNAHVENMQRNAFRRIHRHNPLLSCLSIPQINLNAWKEKNPWTGTNLGEEMNSSEEGNMSEESSVYEERNESREWDESYERNVSEENDVSEDRNESGIGDGGGY